MVFVVFAALSAGGCATITSSEMQQINLSASTSDGQPVTGANCALRNDKGTWQGTTPGFVSVHKSSQDLSVECKKDGVPDGLLRAISRVSGGMVGNIIFGGGIGAIIDHTKGTGYNYPDNMPVVMGGSVTVDRATQQTGVAPKGTQPATGPTGEAASAAPPVSDFDRQRAQSR
jgi:hypothetical protein